MQVSIAGMLSSREEPSPRRGQAIDSHFHVVSGVSTCFCKESKMNVTQHINGMHLCKFHSLLRYFSQVDLHPLIYSISRHTPLHFQLKPNRQSARHGKGMHSRSPPILHLLLTSSFLYIAVCAYLHQAIYLPPSSRPQLSKHK